MKQLVSSRQAAGRLGVSLITLQRHIADGSVDAPPLQTVGGVKIRLWSHRNVEKARRVLAKIKPGRKRKV